MTRGVDTLPAGGPRRTMETLPAAAAAGGDERGDPTLLWASTLIVGAVNFCYSLALVWLLHTTVYPTFVIGQVMLLTVASVAGAGIPWVLAREIAVAGGDPARRRRATSFALVTGLGQGLIAGLLVATLMARFGSLGVVVATAASAALISGSTIVIGYLQGENRIGAIAVLRLVDVAVKIGSGLLLWWAGAGVAGVLFGFSLGSVPILACGLWVMRRNLPVVWRAALDTRLWRQAMGMLAIQLPVAVVLGLDVVVAALINHPGRELATYEAALIVGRVPVFLSIAAGLTVFPVLAAVSGNRRAVAIRSSLAIYATVTVPLVIVLATVPQQLLSAALPDGYETFPDVLGLTAAAGGLFGAINLLTTYFQAAERFRACTTLLAAGIVLQTILLVAGSRSGGIAGLARADVAGGLIIVGVLTVVTHARWPQSTRGLLRVLLITTVGSSPLFLLRGNTWLWLPFATLVGAGVVLECIFYRKGGRAGDRLRVLHLAFEDDRQPGSGGGAIRTREINSRLGGVCDITVVTAAYPGSRARDVDGVHHRHVGIPVAGFAGKLAYFALIPFALMRYPSDVVVEDFAAPFSSAFVPLLTGRPVVGVCQWLFAREKSRQYRLPFFLFEEAGVRTYRRIVTVSEDLAVRLRSMTRADVVVVPNGVDHLISRLPRTTGVRSDFVFLGRLELAHKGLDMLVEAFALASRDVRANLIVAGDGPDAGAVRDLVRARGLEDRVRFAGRLGPLEARELLANARLAIMPSRYESFGMVALEAMSVGTPVVGFDIPGLREVLPARCGVLVPAFDVEALATALARLDADPTLRERMGRAGARRSNRYRWDELACSQYAVYMDAVDDDRRTERAAPRTTTFDAVVTNVFADRPRRRRVLLIGNYGNGNVGDDAILTAITDEVGDRADLVVLSRNPREIASNEQVRAVPMLSSHAVLALFGCDTVVIGGGGLFGAGIPRLPSLLPLVSIGSRLIGKRTAFLSIGAYDDMPQWVMTTLRVATVLSSAVSVRDLASYRVLDRRVLGRAIGPTLVDDPALGLRPASRERGRDLLAAAGASPTAAPLIVSLKPMPGTDASESLLAELRVAIDWWCAHRKGDVVLMALSRTGDFGIGASVTDAMLAQRLMASAGHPHRLHHLGPDLAPRDAKAAIGAAHAVVAMRLHAQIFAAGMLVPVFGITFEQKATSFLQSCNGASADAAAFSAGRLIEWLDSAAA